MDSHSKKEFEREFLEYHLPVSIPLMKVGLVITLTLFLLYAILNETFFPGSETGRYFLRFGIIFPSILLSLTVISIKSLKRKLNLILTVINLLTAIPVFVVGAFTGISVKGYDYYYTWVGLVIIGIFTFYRIRLRNLVITGFILILAYVAAILYNNSYHDNPEMFLNQLLFVVSMASMGFFIAYIFEMKNRKDFTQNKELTDHYTVLVNEMKAKESAQAELVQTQMKYLHALDAIPDMVYITDTKLRIMLVNSSLKDWDRIFNNNDDIIGTRVDKRFPFINPEVYSEEMNYVINTGNIHLSEKKYLVKGADIFIEVRKVPIFFENNVTQIMVILRDISKKKEVEDLKLRNAEQKEVMLREIHHRVKNNLAIVISLLSLQMRHTPNPDLKKPMKDIELRIRSMALIHEHLYRSEHLDRIPLSNYLHSLSVIILGTLSEGNIRLIPELTPTDISIETALPLGLITNELVTNSIKYAFPDKREGELWIALNPESDEGGNYRLTIRDNGIGLPQGFSFENQTSMGMFIVKLLVQQLGAKLEIENTSGACFHIIFKNLIT